MPLMDLAATLMDAQDVHATDSTVVSTNAYDLGSPGTDAIGNTIVHDPGQSNLNVECRVTTAASGGTSAKFQVITSASANLGSPTVVASSEAIAVASLVAGYRFLPCRVPVGVTQRYLGCQIVTVGAVAALNVTAAVVVSPSA